MKFVRVPYSIYDIDYLNPDHIVRVTSTQSAIKIVDITGHTYIIGVGDGDINSIETWDEANELVDKLVGK